MKSQDLLTQFLQKAQRSVTVTDSRKWYDIMISRKQRNFLVNLYKRENNDYNNPCEDSFTKIGEFYVSLGRLLYNGAYKITFQKI